MIMMNDDDDDDDDCGYDHDGDMTMMIMMMTHDYDDDDDDDDVDDEDDEEDGVDDDGDDGESCEWWCILMTVRVLMNGDKHVTWWWLYQHSISLMHFCTWLCLFSMGFRHWQAQRLRRVFHPGDQITTDKFQNGKPPAENVFEPGNVEQL